MFESIDLATLAQAVTAVVAAGFALIKAIGALIKIVSKKAA